MQEFLSEINYDQLVNKHLKGVIHDALQIASIYGLPGENHFYVTFRTDVDGVEIPPMLKTRYPESMTIVLQHQFSNLTVDDEKFSVDLMFGGIPYTLTIPYQAVSYFADPSARFGLSFSAENGAEDSSESAETEVASPESKSAEVISIDRFRKK